MAVLTIAPELEQSCEEQYNAVLVSGRFMVGCNSDDYASKNVISKQELLNHFEKCALHCWVTRSHYVKVIFEKATVFDERYLISEEEKLRFIELAKKGKECL